MAFWEWLLINGPWVVTCGVAGWALSEAKSSRKYILHKLDMFKEFEFDPLEENIDALRRDGWNRINREELQSVIHSLRLDIEKQNQWIAVLENTLDERTKL